MRTIAEAESWKSSASSVKNRKQGHIRSRSPDFEKFDIASEKKDRARLQSSYSEETVATNLLVDEVFKEIHSSSFQSQSDSGEYQGETLKCFVSPLIDQAHKWSNEVDHKALSRTQSASISPTMLRQSKRAVHSKLESANSESEQYFVRARRPNQQSQESECRQKDSTRQRHPCVCVTAELLCHEQQPESVHTPSPFARSASVCTAQSNQETDPSLPADAPCGRRRSRSLCCPPPPAALPQPSSSPRDGRG
eukprot:CAMPEP_0113697518 /NCGR_PEP_ID=MMETSP0038_2-20120614/22180_1 /TAXON_ID=2898 /ORGANISM="Cryptomonas paramecium" /LENGTH=250 /DNA_ID=CAMNT_0000620541 /DNA_START=30 /DNA_END=779 /DNA_ORIENTATION=- /assembly_acc=CAM_ASM_000170